MNIGTVVELLESLIKSAPVSSGDGAYGAGMAGAPFNPLEFVKKPQVILRVISVVFAIIVFGSIASEELYKSGTCPMDNDSGACDLGIGVGVIAFLACIAFLILDARFDAISTVKVRRRAVIADLAFSAAWTAMWFFTFCYLTNAWLKTTDEMEEQANGHLIRASIAFSFFSIITWAMICLLNFLRYRQGVSEVFQGYEEANAATGPGMAGYDNLSSSNDTYRQAPFNNVNPNAGYQQTNY